MNKNAGRCFPAFFISTNRTDKIGYLNLPGITNVVPYMNNKTIANNFGFRFQNSYAELNPSLYSRLAPVPVSSPSLVLWNAPLAEESGLLFNEDHPGKIASIFSGNTIPKGAAPLAQAYAGHQFGHFTMLGDGRAIVLGEQITPTNQRIDIQLKGSGQTPYSRRGDGRATLYSMLREYLISEAMHHLGIPTSRSLAVTTTGEPVYRETTHQGAVLARVASSHIRVGTFEYVRYMHEHLLKDFTFYTIKRHYPELLNTDKPALELLKRVMEKQASLIVKWMQAGFIHGVMNTDNTGIAAETFDYGPCAFINAYHPQKVFSSIDHYRRYAFGNQPGITQWNLGCLAVALLPLIDKDETKATEMVKEVLEQFEGIFSKEYVNMMAGKLGIETPNKEDTVLMDDLLKWMQDNEADFTNTFLVLEKGVQFLQSGNPTIYNQPDFKTWHIRWKQRIGQDQEQTEKARSIMKQFNPWVVPRNHIVEEALEEASEDNNFQPLHQLMEVLSAPYLRREIPAKYQSPPPSGDENYQTFCGT